MSAIGAAQPAAFDVGDGRAKFAAHAVLLRQPLRQPADYVTRVDAQLRRTE
jgi:hypothetical protein